MRRIKPSPNAHQWPRHAVANVECRKRDLVIRIADWTRNHEEPAFDVECYIGGVYDWNESQTFTVDPDRDSTSFRGRTKEEAKAKAIAFAQRKIAELLEGGAK